MRKCHDFAAPNRAPAPEVSQTSQSCAHVTPVDSAVETSYVSPGQERDGPTCAPALAHTHARGVRSSAYRSP